MALVASMNVEVSDEDSELLVVTPTALMSGDDDGDESICFAVVSGTGVKGKPLSSLDDGWLSSSLFGTDLVKAWAQNCTQKHSRGVYKVV